MIPKFGSDNPRAGLYEKEFQGAFVKVCSLICILKNKKLNMPNIFIEIKYEYKGKEKEYNTSWLQSG